MSARVCSRRYSKDVILPAAAEGALDLRAARDDRRQHQPGGREARRRTRGAPASTSRTGRPRNARSCSSTTSGADTMGSLQAIPRAQAATAAPCQAFRSLRRPGGERRVQRQQVEEAHHQLGALDDVDDGLGQQRMHAPEQRDREGRGLAAVAARRARGSAATARPRARRAAPTRGATAGSRRGTRARRARRRA